MYFPRRTQKIPQQIFVGSNNNPFHHHSSILPPQQQREQQQKQDNYTYLSESESTYRQDIIGDISIKGKKGLLVTLHPIKNQSRLTSLKFPNLITIISNKYLKFVYHQPLIKIQQIHHC
ncbi:unnamed protein product [Cunninghamella blakesleeana]